MTIIFKKLRYQNLLSTGNVFTEVDLNKFKSTLVVGENGAGKSSFIEAITFALYGKPFRNINKPQLINSITGKNLLVEIEFSVGKKNYLVRRGMKPSVFEIWQDDKMLNQQAGSRDDQEYLEKTILKLNYKSFNQIVVLGSANYTPFMQLPAAQRRAVVEDLLDIQIFSVMNSILKEKVNTNKTDLMEIDYKIDLCEQKIELHNKHIEALKTNNEELIEQKRVKIQENEEQIKQYNDSIQRIMLQVEELNNTISDYNKIDARRNKLLHMELSLEDKVRKINKELEFFHNHDNCPTCKQGIDHDFKVHTVEMRNTKKDEISLALDKIGSEIKQAQDRITYINSVNKEIQSLNSTIQTHNQQIQFCQKYITSLNKEIDDIIEQSSKLNSNDADDHQYEQELLEYKKHKERLLKQKSVYDVASHLLKDSGIKTKIIKQYVPIMNKLINKYLAALDFFVEFTLDESFNETIKSRFRDEFTYASFSEGEKARLDLALMFAWRAIAKLRNSAATNLLIMDEVFDGSLDGKGNGELLDILNSLASDTNIFCISHKGDQLYERFDSVIKFEKHGNFSRIASVEA